MHTNPKFVAKTCCQTRKYTSGQFGLNFALQLIQQVILFENVRQLGLNHNSEKQKSISERNWNIPKWSLTKCSFQNLCRTSNEVQLGLVMSWNFIYIQFTLTLGLLTELNCLGATYLQVSISPIVLAVFSSYMYSLCLYFFGGKEYKQKKLLIKCCWDWLQKTGVCSINHIR